MFYNENQKNRYLLYCKYELTTIESIKVIFNSISPVENHYNKDVSLFVGEQIVDLLKKFNSKSRNFLRVVCAYLFDYYNWCLDENLVPKNNFGNPFDINRTKRIIEEIVPKELLNNKFYTKEKHLEYLDKINDPSNQLILHSIYLGINGDESEEIRRLQITELSEERKQVRLFTGRIVNVDNLFIDLMKKTANAKYYYPDGTIESSKIGYYTYSRANYVLRACTRGEEFDNAPISKQVFFARTRLIKKQSGNPLLTVSVIYRNGLINYIKEKYKEQNISLDKALFDMKNNQSYAYDQITEEYISEFGSKMTARMLRMLVKDYMDCI